MLRRAVDLADATSGVFDVTIGPLVALWKDAAANNAPPSQMSIERALGSVGARHIVFLPNHRIRFSRPGMWVDLGGIGKGYAMDCAEVVLRRNGIHRALLNFGGQILALDPPPDTESWPVWIRDPTRPGGFLAEIGITNRALSTSADDQRGVWIGGRRYSHIIDPKTGFPVSHAVCASVLATRAEAADAWSSALFASDRAAAARFTSRNPFAVLRVDNAGDVLNNSEEFVLARHPSPR